MELENLWKNSAVAPSKTHHIINDIDAYARRFHNVLKFHPPGLAAVKDHSGAYHITIDGNPVYTKRFKKTFGFYNARASVQGVKGWFHIYTNGEPVYSDLYSWCGNFQDKICVVSDNHKAFFHIDLSGNRLYDEFYAYAGDFRDGVAVVQFENGEYAHINREGKLFHKGRFLDLDVYHKGFARAKDSSGWCHIDANGKPIYSERYNMIEPFYNGYARVETSFGEMLRINEEGTVIEQIRCPLSTPFQALSADLVGYWRTQTIKAAVDLNLFEYLPADVETLAHHSGVSEKNILRLLRALEEMKLVSRKGMICSLTETSKHLRVDDSMSLYEAVKHWSSAHYLTWIHLAQSIRDDKPAYEKVYQDSLFDWLDRDPLELRRYQHAMTAYAKHDYHELAKHIDLKQSRTVIDAGGGEGTLLSYILEYNPRLNGILLERESVVSCLDIPDALQTRLSAVGFDLFQSWPKQADAIVLSRVLHDWNDDECLLLLKNARCSLNDEGKLFIIEMLLESDKPKGGMLDLNMLVITGGQERTLREYQNLGANVGLAYSNCTTVGNYSIISFSKST